MNIAEMLDRYLTATMTTVVDCAAYFGVRRATVYRWLSGEDIPSDKRADAFAAFFGVDIGEVLVALHESRSAGAEPRQMQDGMMRVMREFQEELTDLRERMAEMTELLERLRGAQQGDD